jgi:hypothetical protein
MVQGQRVLAKVQLDSGEHVEYEIEIIRFGKLQNKPWQMEGAERYQQALQLKVKANAAIGK